MNEEIDGDLDKAKSLSKKGLHREALSICEKVIGAHPDFFHAYEVRSSIFRRAGDYRHAIEDVSQVIRLMPGSAAPLFRRGRYLMSEGQFRAAASDFSKAMELDDGYFGDALRFYRAEALLRCNDYQGALADCQAIDSNYSERHFFGHSERTCADIEAAAKAALLKGTNGTKESGSG